MSTPNPSPLTDALTRRTFMKKSALTLGAVTILSRGIAFAGTDGFPGLSGELKEVPKTETVTVTLTQTQTAGQGTDSAAVINGFNDMWPENAHASGPAELGEIDPSGTKSETITTKQMIRPDAKLNSSDSVVTEREPITLSGGQFQQKVTTVRTYVYGDPTPPPNP